MYFWHTLRIPDKYFVFTAYNKYFWHILCGTHYVFQTNIWYFWHALRISDIRYVSLAYITYSCHKSCISSKSYVFMALMVYFWHTSPISGINHVFAAYVMYFWDALYQNWQSQPNWPNSKSRSRVYAWLCFTLDGSCHTLIQFNPPWKFSAITHILFGTRRA